MSIRVVELFAGVGGFRLGLEGYPRRKDCPFEVVWSNQWEPSTKKQHASLVYEHRWPKANHANANIEEVIENSFDLIPDHDLLVGGFPCQDYSVATTLSNSKGLRGKKGVLWWSIEAILRKKGERKPKYLMLENVDRLLKSPATQRGRDFAIMLSSLNALGYVVEWRVINAADYGIPQRRRRIFILAYHSSTPLGKEMKAARSKLDWLTRTGIFATGFPVKETQGKPFSETIHSDLKKVSDDFNKEGKPSPFLNTGLMADGKYWTLRTEPDFNGAEKVLEDVLVPTADVPDAFFISEAEVRHKTGWEFQKGAKKLQRTKQNGHTYAYSEGGMTFPDPLDRPSRTIITAEGGRTPSRFKHVILKDGRYRRLVPKELERLNMFPDDHTAVDGISDQQRAFFMGNALVVGIVEKLGQELASRIG
jgi:DNA (cytosine-5)-methyltransferase 1